MPEIDGVRVPFIPAGGVNELQKRPQVQNKVDNGNTFKTVFKDALDNLKFSAHARARISSREVTIEGNDINRLNNAVNRAEAKGAREALVIMDDKAFIINVTNKTVITAVNKEQLDSNVITNIDAAVIA